MKKFKDYIFNDRQKESCLAKYKYSSEEIAWQDIYQREIPEYFLDVYKCPVCNGFHITSRF